MNICSFARSYTRPSPTGCAFASCGRVQSFYGGTARIPLTPPEAGRCEAPAVRAEGAFSQGKNITLIRDIKVQIGRSRRASQPDFSFMSGVTVDERKPVYDIRGSFVMYVCRAGASNSCMVDIMPAQTGICFVDNFGDWRCRMLGAPSRTLRNAPWPTN
jgi:hypothetical protein